MALPQMALTFWLVTLGLALGCGGGFDCNRSAGKCPNDPSVDPFSVNACQSFLADPNCGAQFNDYGTCVLNAEQCDASGNGNIASAQASCASLAASVRNCCAQHADAGNCGQTN